MDLSLYPLATGFRTRLLGLSLRDRDRAGPGLLFRRCSSVHTFGMRFDLDVFFLDRAGRVVEVRRGVPPRRVIWCRGACAVLEIPAAEGGENRRPRTSTPHAPPTRRDSQPGRLRGRRNHP